MKLSGSQLADAWLKTIAADVKALAKAPRLAIVRVGEDAASATYVSRKVAAAKKGGIEAKEVALMETVSTQEVVQAVQTAAAETDGLIVQLPLPPSIDRAAVLDAVPPAKDVDGLTRANLGALVRQEEGFVPATPLGIMRLIESQRSLKGLHVTIVGAGMLVGRPLALALLKAGAVVTVADKTAKILSELTRPADVIVASAGSPGLIRGEHVSINQIVIDAGFSVVQGKPVGDVAYDEVEPIVAVITPVPGGVGPMTVAALLANVILAAKSLNKST